MKPLSKMSYPEYIADSKNEIIAERYLERLTGRMIDINYHLIIEQGYPPPKDYFESFVMLGKLNILSEKFANRIAKSAGLRNILAHEYNEIDDRKIHQAIKISIVDVPKYLKFIEKFISKK